MTDKTKGILINGVINTLNEEIRKENKELCRQNLHSQQKPLLGGDMFFRLAFMTDEQIKNIVTACGL